MKTLALVLALILLPVTLTAQVTATYQGAYDVQTNGDDSTYMQGFTHRYVGGELRFLTLTHTGWLHEFRKPAAFGAKADTIVQDWNLSPTGALNNFSGIWFEQAKNRLWVTSAEDYTNVNHPAKVTILTLGANRAVTVVKTFYLNVPAKRVYGGCNAVPSSLVASIGGAYTCGWGGYTSLVAQGGGASIGPTMYAIPDPDTIANGATVTARTVLDHAASRGVRRTIPINYFDGGDPRQNPGSRPTGDPVSTAAWLSPNAQGLGWQVWGDSYYNTGMWVGTTFVSVLSGCKGGCWYQSSTLAFDGRQFEMHQWSGAGLGSNILKQPDVMTELLLPRGNTVVWGGNIPTGNIAGATYDATTGSVYLIGFPLGPDVHTGRLYQFSVGAGSPPPPPPPVATDAVVSAWSAWTGDVWSACSGGTQTRTETRTRTVVTAATNGGTTPALSETRTASQSCAVTPPVEPPTETITHADLKAILDRIEAAMAAPPVVTFNVTVTSIGSSYANGDRRLTIRVPLASMPVAPVNGAVLRVVKD
jgi:hypothetical protein